MAKSTTASKRKKPVAAPSTEPPSHFFQKQLIGEEPLSSSTAEKLYFLATRIAVLQPWSFLGDEDLFLLRDPDSGSICYCSVMGAMGEVFALHMYSGSESYRFLKQLISGVPVTPDEFFACQTGVNVEFVKISELTPPDRDLLKWLGHPLKRGSRAPIFRALRPGFHPWYITEPEGRILAECMLALAALSKIVMAHPRARYWEQEDVYPLLVPHGQERPEPEYKVEMVNAPCPPPSAPQPATVDQTRLNKLRDKDYALRGCFETDCFFSPVVVGDKDERKSCMRMGLVTDAASGFLFAPELGLPGQSAGEILINALFKAVNALEFLPAEIRVSTDEFKSLLDPVAGQLGISVNVAQSLPSLDRARDSMLSMMMGMR